MMRPPFLFRLLALGLASPWCLASPLEDAQSALARKDFVQAAENFRAHLSTKPDDLDARFQLARALAWQNRYADADTETAVLLHAAPDNPDFLLLRAQILFWQQRVVEALTYTGHARAVAPAYRDVWELEFQLRAAHSPAPWPPTTLAAQFQKLFPGQIVPWRRDKPALSVANEALTEKDFPLATVSLRDHLVEKPGDHDARLMLSRTLAWQQLFDDATAELVTVLKATPDNVDALLLQAQLLRWQGDSYSALPIIDRARRIAPKYHELWVLAFELRADTSEDGYPPLDLIAEFRKYFITEPIPWKRAPPDIRKTAAISTLYERPSNSSLPWWDHGITWTTEEPRRRDAGFELRRVQRYGIADETLGMRIGWIPIKDWRLEVQTGGSDFGLLLPKAFVGGNAEWRWRPNHIATVDYFHAAYRYAATDRTRVRYTLRLGAMEYSGALTDTLINTLENTVAAELRIDYAPLPAHRFTYGIVAGEELEVTEKGRIIRWNSRAQRLAWQHDFSKLWGLTATLLHAALGRQATRTGGQLGLTFHY